eukprot:evm.model.scf_199.1 EVM.evm.TU.scf_199.1   scf_199:7126-10460(+)
MGAMKCLKPCAQWGRGMTVKASLWSPWALPRSPRPRTHRSGTHAAVRGAERLASRVPCPLVLEKRGRRLRFDADTPWFHIPITASWGKDVEFSKATMVKSEKVATKLQSLSIDIGPLGSTYTTPGQYLQLKVSEDAGPAFMAIASPPDPNNAGMIEILVKNQGETAEQLCKLQEGDELLASAVMGKGFPVDQIAPEDVGTVFLFATGSGISPVRALIESEALALDRRQTAILYYGAVDREAMAYVDKLPEWESLGVQVVPVYSSSGVGYVQDVFDKENLLGSPDDVGVVLCGQKEMCQAVTEMMEGAGVDPGRIILNF